MDAEWPQQERRIACGRDDEAVGGDKALIGLDRRDPVATTLDSFNRHAVFQRDAAACAVFRKRERELAAISDLLAREMDTACERMHGLAQGRLFLHAGGRIEHVEFHALPA